MPQNQAERILFENDVYTLTSCRVAQGEDEALLLDDEQLLIRRPSRAGDGDESTLVSIPPVAAHLPQYRGDLPILRSMYGLALHELASTQNEAGEFTAGAQWDGVWTRDVSYAIILGAAFAQPDACRRSLDARIEEGLILQDTGTGGGWPVSTDRVIWILAAWVYVRVSGDKDWLQDRIEVMLRTIHQDEAVLQRQQGLFPGETSFLDWREQSYPDWMTPADIGASCAFGTNLLHAAARRVLASLLRLLGRDEEAARFKADAQQLIGLVKDQFWNSAKRLYGMMRTADGVLDDRPDALATSLGVLLGLLGEHAQEALAHLPRSPFGTAVFGPSKCSQIDSYHNRSVWPFAESYALLAHAELQDHEGMAFSMASLLRAAMLFGSNMENLHAVTGEALGTVQNSRAQLWSAAGMLGMFYHGLFGIRFDGHNMLFTPCIPQAYAGSHWLMGLRVGKMVIDVHIQGYGSEICSAQINGCMSAPLIALDGEGRLVVELVVQPSMEGGDADEQELFPTPSLVEDLAEPQWADSTNEVLRWHPVEGASAYRVFCRGKAIAQTASCYHTLTSMRCAARYRIQAIHEQRFSCLNVPLALGDEPLKWCAVSRVGPQGQYEVEHGQAWLHPCEDTAQLYFQPIELRAGTYEINVEYSNACYSLRDGDGCALRALYLNEESLGIVLLPQQGEQGDWARFYLNAAHILTLEEARSCEFSLRYTSDCVKTGENQALVRALRVRKICEDC